jgi:hypothetical protein
MRRRIQLCDTSEEGAKNYIVNKLRKIPSSADDDVVEPEVEIRPITDLTVLKRERAISVYFITTLVFLIMWTLYIVVVWARQIREALTRRARCVAQAIGGNITFAFGPVRAPLEIR